VSKPKKQNNAWVRRRRLNDVRMHIPNRKRGHAMHNVIDFQVARGPLTIPPYIDRRGELSEYQ